MYSYNILSDAHCGVVQIWFHSHFTVWASLGLGHGLCVCVSISEAITKVIITKVDYAE